MFIKELDARVTRALASSVTPMHSKCTPLAFSNFLALVFFNQRSKLPRNLLLFQTQVLQSSTNQNKLGKSASKTVSFHSFAYSISGTAWKIICQHMIKLNRQNNPICTSSASAPQLSATLAVPPWLDTLALVHCFAPSNITVLRLYSLSKTVLLE